METENITTKTEKRIDENSHAADTFFSNNEGSSFFSIDSAIAFPGIVKDDNAKTAITKCKNVGRRVDNIIKVNESDVSLKGSIEYSSQVISENGKLEKNANTIDIDSKRTIPITTSTNICVIQA